MAEGELVTLKDGGQAIVRPLRSCDGPGLSGFYESLGAVERHYFYPYPVAMNQGERIADTAGQQDHITLLAWDPEETNVLGYVFVRFTRQHTEPLLGICVRPDAQQNGIGRALLTRALRAARARQLAEVTLGVHKDNHRALRLYKSVGFKVCGETRNVIQGVVQWKMRVELGDGGPDGFGDEV